VSDAAHEHPHGDQAPAGHQHDHGGHSHRLSADADRRYLTIALALIVGFMAVEIVAGILANSLALLSDAAHMLTDAGALALSLAVIWYVGRPGEDALTYGRRRAEVLSAQANGAVLLVLAALVSYESIVRLFAPPDVAGLAVTVVAGVGLVINLAAAAALARANRQSLNIEGSYQHILMDLYASVGTLIAGLVVTITGFDRADAIASLAVAGLMFKSGWALQRKAMRVLLEGAPEGIRPHEIGGAMARAEHVRQVHDLHVWELAPGHPILTAHVLVEAGADTRAVRRALEQLLQQRFGIGHTTLQVDHAPDDVFPIQRPSRPWPRGGGDATTA
jgi:cobalt-zinc-cadmium efflux system protein